MYVIVWQYQVKSVFLQEFENAYGPAGIWAEFFVRDPNYLGMELLRQQEVNGRYLTIDRWQSQAAYDQFKERWRAEYQEIDKRCAFWTEQEALIGAFEDLGGFTLPIDR